MNAEVKSNIDSYLTQGLSKGKEGKYKEAESIFNEIIDKYPEYGPAYAYRGFFRHKIELNFEGALKDYSKVIELDLAFTKKERIFYLRAEVKSELDDCVGAIADYSKSIEFKSMVEDSLLSRGLLLFSSEKLFEAMTDFNSVIKINDKNVDAYRWRALVKNELEDTDGALRDLETALEIDPFDSESYYITAQIFFGLGKEELNDGYVFSAIENYDLSIQYDKDSEYKYCERGDAKAYIGNYADAIEDYDKAIEIDDEYAEAYFNRAKAKYELGLKKEACIDFSKAGELGDEEAYKEIKRLCK
jgi:tetratricopeptide (TPR) repeat protein